MTKNQNGFASYLFVVLAVLLVIGAAGTYIYKRHQTQAAQNGNISNNSPSGCVSREIPGKIEITAPNNTSQQKIQEIIKPINGTISIYNPEGFDEISVPKGSEAKAIEYLKTRQLVQSAERAINACPVTGLGD